MSKYKRNSNVRKFIRMPDLNVGFIIFIVIFLYVIVSVVMFVFSDKTVIYEVSAGTLSSDTSYTGVIVRDEQLIKSDYSGSINYFVKSNEKVGKNTVVYSIDETGRVSDQIAKSTKQALSQSDLNEIRDTFSEYTQNYDAMDFDNVYTVNQNVSDQIYEYQMNSIVDNLDDIISTTNDGDFFHQVKAVETGVVSYSVDGYEGLTEKDITEKLFSSTDLSATSLQSETLVNKGDTAYKIITDDKWSIYIPLDDTQASSLADSTSVNIEFIDSNISCKADFSLVTLDKKVYGKISMTKYLINFSDKRFVRIELEDTSDEGLKIPKTAVFKKNFYTIPVEYLTDSGTFMKQTYDSQGNMKIKSVEATIFEQDDTYCYVSTSEFNSGDILAKADSDDTYIVGTLDELSGVYCINKGYVVFRKVDIIGKNDEYYIAKKGTAYGLSIYDHIVLDYSTVDENELVN